MFQFLNRFLQGSVGCNGDRVRADCGGNFCRDYCYRAGARRQPERHVHHSVERVEVTAIEALETRRALADCKFLRLFCGCQGGTIASNVPVSRSIFGPIRISAPNWDNLRLKIFIY
jgi:hypothetical protein